jgi:hypothetical protein
MALTSTTVVDLIGGTQTITFSDPDQVDQITFSNNQITFQSSSTYNLSKTDLLLYFQYLLVFNTLLQRNFPSFNASVNQPWPLCSFSISETNVGVKKIIYDQTSTGTTVLHINYVPIAQAASFATRSSPVTISLQEYLSTIDLLQIYAIQINLN